MRGTVVLTASAGSLPGLAEQLRELSMVVLERPLIRFVPPDDWTAVDAAIDDARAGKYAAIAFTSPRAAEAFVGRLMVRGWTWPSAARTEVWATGIGTARALEGAVGQVHTPMDIGADDQGAAERLARALIGAEVGGRVLFPCGDRRRDELPARLRAAGIEVDEVMCYRSVLASELEARDVAKDAAVLVVASPSVAQLLARACPPTDRPALLAIGPITAAASQAVGWPAAAIATHPTTEAVSAAARSLVS